MESEKECFGFRLSGGLYRLQELRLAQALSEAGAILSVSESELPIMQHLGAYFDFQWRVGEAEIITPSIDHSKPLTGIGSLSRSLIFPHAVVHQCGSGWTSSRPIEFGFAGLVTPKREEVLKTWADKAGKRLHLSNMDEGQLMHPRTDNDVVVWASHRGRTFPVKAWDSEYYDFMRKTRFALCPTGDFTWTYRVFEAALCGAIPVVESMHPAYEGLTLFRMQDRAKDFAYDRSIAEANFLTAKTLITVSHPELRLALQEVLSEQDGARW